jgi:hypothetical protein
MEWRTAARKRNSGLNHQVMPRPIEERLRNSFIYLFVYLVVSAKGISPLPEASFLMNGCYCRYYRKCQ